MRLENCLEDMSVISNALATVTSNASRFSNAKVKPKQAVKPLAYQRFRGSVNPTTKHMGFTAREYVSTAGISVEKNNASTKLAEIEGKFTQLTAKHVKLAHAISDLSAEKIRTNFGESSYEDLKNVDLTIRGLEGYINKLIRDANQPHPYIKRLSGSITEYRLAISDLLMILDQCFNEVEFTESQTGLIDENVFDNFSFH